MYLNCVPEIFVPPVGETCSEFPEKTVGEALVNAVKLASEGNFLCH